MTDWQDVVTSREWLEAVRSPRRRVDVRVELVDGDGVTIGTIPVDGVQITMSGSSQERWAATFSLSDESWTPLNAGDLLDPRSMMRARVWWRVYTSGGWLECPVGTYMLEDPQVDDDGLMTYTLDGVDPLNEARRGGYRGATVDLGGMTVAQALDALFGMVAPLLPRRIASTSVMMPAVYTVGSQEPAQDWTDIAAIAGWSVWTDREGVIVCGKPPQSADVVEVWTEGDDACAVISVQRTLKTSTMINRVSVVSTSTEIAAPIRETVEDDDPASPTWVGVYGPYETTIESDVVSTPEAAQNMARATFERWRKPQETVEIEIPSRPDLDVGDLVALGRARAGVAGLYRVESWTWTASAEPQPMRVTMATRMT